MNASSNANTLIGYKMSYYRSMYGIDICNANPLCLTPDQHAQMNSLYELSLAKSNHIIIDGFDPDEITDPFLLLLQVDFITNICYIYIYIFIVQCIPLCV